MTRFNTWLTTVENVIAGLALATATVVAVGAVFMRTAFNILIFWSEEVIIYSIIASTFFGAIITLRENEHVNVDILPAVLSARGKKVMALIAGTIVMLYLGVIGYFAWLLIFEPFSVATVTPALHLPLWVVELCLPIAFTLMFLRAGQMLWQTWRSAPVELSAEEVAIAEAEAAGIDVEQMLAVRHRAEEEADGGAGRRDAGSTDETERPSDERGDESR